MHLIDLERAMEVALTSVSLGFSVLNKVLSTSALILLMRSNHKYHRNHLLLRYNFILGCYFSCVGTFASSVCRLVILNGVDISDSTAYKLFMTLESLGPNMFRLSFVSFMLERAFATTKMAAYEKDKRFLIIGPVLVIASIGLSATMSISYNFLNAPIIVLYTIYISLDCISLMCALILNSINHKLQIINDRTDLRLSSRYQISENIRVFKFLYKLLIFGILIAVLCTASSLSIRAMTLRNYQLLARISYFGLWNCYGGIAAFLIAKDCLPNNYRCCYPRYRPNDYYAVPVIHKLAIDHSIDEHFKCLQEFWTKNSRDKNAARV